jgi:hypothetical protein
MIDGWDVNPDSQVKLGRARKLLSLDVLYQANNGDKAAAIADLRTLVRIAIQLQGDERLGLQRGTLIASATINSSIQQFINGFGDPRSARKLLDIVGSEPRPPGLGVALPHELASEYYNISSDLYRQISNPDSPVNELFSNVIPAIQDVPGITVRDALRARLLQFLVKLKEATNQKGITLQQEEALVDKITTGEMGGDATYCLNVASPGDTYTGFLKNLVYGLVRKDVTLTGLRILSERRTGGWPKILPKSSPLDLYTNAPLCYHSSASGFIVYSVGEEHKDYLGETKDYAQNISFRYPQNWKVVPDKPSKAKKYFAPFFAQ